MKTLLAAILFAYCVLTMRLIYENPVYSLKNPNFTLGGLFELTNATGQVSVMGMDRAIAMMCTLKEFNEGTSKAFQVSGVFNGLIYDAGGTLEKSEYAAMRLLEYNLKRELGNNLGVVDFTGEGIQVGAIITGIDTAIFFATQPVFSGFPLTFLGVQFLTSGIETNTTMEPRPNFKARIVPQSFVISAAASSAMALAIVQVLKYFNWSLVTVLYGRETFGTEGQGFLQPLLEENSILNICSLVTRASDASNEPIDELAACLNENDSRVVILWTGADTEGLIKLAQSIQARTKYKLVFITPEADLSTASYVSTSSLEPISTSFLFKNVNLVPFTDSFRACLEFTNLETQQYFKADLFNEYWRQKFNCSSDDDQCMKTSILSSTIEINQAADSTMLILKSISLMQNNCTFLNSILDSYDLNTLNKNFCQLETFTAADIYQILNLILYLGLPEFLALGTPLEGDAGLSRSLQILQINQTGSFISVGNYSSSTDTLKIDNNSLYWTDGDVPESEVQVDNPTLSDAIVAVFFSFAVLGIAISCILKGIFIYYRKSRLFRKSSPWFSFLTLLGIDFIFSAVISYGTTYTTLTCFYYAWALTIGCGLCLANIFIKSYRIFRIFKNPKAKAISISDTELLVFTAVVLISEIVLLSIYSFSSGLLGPQVIQSSHNIYYKFRICLVPSKAVQLCFLVLIYSFNLFILLAIALLAFLSRKIDNSYSEARGISYTVYGTILFQIIFLPLLYTSGDSTDSSMTRYTLNGIIILLTCYLAMIFLFCDKVIQQFKQKQE